MDVLAVDRLVGPREHVREHHAREAGGDDVEELRARAEPPRGGERLEHRGPEERARREERDVLERVHGVVPERSLVEVRQVPEVEVDRPQRPGHERVGEHAQPVNPLVGEERTKQRARQPGDDRQRRELSEQHVLRHVHEEELLLAPRVERREERKGDERQADPERPAAPGGDGRSATRERPCAAVIEEAAEGDGDDCERIERPARQQREVLVGAAVSEDHSAENRLAA